MVKHDIPNRPFMIVQSIDKLPVASGDRVVARVTCIWFSSDLKLQKAGFPQRTLSKKCQIHHNKWKASSRPQHCSVQGLAGFI
jgi:hypothetical protein